MKLLIQPYQFIFVALLQVELADEWASSPIIPVKGGSSMSIIHYTPHYLYAPTVPFELPELFRGYIEETKFIVALRDPIQRSESSYWFKNSRIFKGVDQGNSGYD